MINTVWSVMSDKHCVDGAELQALQTFMAVI